MFSKVEKIQIERQYHQNYWKHWVKIQSLKKKDGLAAILKTDKRMRGRKQIVQVADNNKNVAIIFKRLMSMQIED